MAKTHVIICAQVTLKTIKAADVFKQSLTSQHRKQQGQSASEFVDGLTSDKMLRFPTNFLSYITFAVLYISAERTFQCRFIKVHLIFRRNYIFD